MKETDVTIGTKDLYRKESGNGKVAAEENENELK